MPSEVTSFESSGSEMALGHEVARDEISGRKQKKKLRSFIKKVNSQ